MTIRNLASLVSVGVVIVGCGSSKPPPGATCLVNTDCNNPLACTFGRCHEACRESRDCPPGARCVTGPSNTNVCQFLDERRCLYTSDCPTPLFCAPDRQCHNQCQATRDCLVKGQTCVEGACADPDDVDPATGKLKPGPDAGVPVPGPDATVDSAPADTSPDAAPADATDAADAARPDAPVDAPVDAASPDLSVDRGVILVAAGPASGHIYYSRTMAAGAPDSEIWVVGADGSGDAKLAAGGRPYVSPDGKYLVFERSGPSGTTTASRGDLWVREIPSGSETKIVTNGDFIVCPSFTSDSAHVLYDYSCSLSIINRDGSMPMGFPSLGGCYSDCPMESPDGMRVALHNDFMGIAVENVDGMKASFVQPNPTGDQFHYPRWSADGAWLSMLNDGKMAPRGQNLFKMHPDGTGSTQLTFAPGGTSDWLTGPGVWTPDGNWVLVAGTIGGVNAIYAVRADGSGEMARIAISAGSPAEYVGSYTN